MTAYDSSVSVAIAEASKSADNTVKALTDILRWAAYNEHLWLIPMVAKSVDAVTCVANNLRSIIPPNEGERGP